MNEAIGQVLPLAVVAALSPFPIIAVVLMLATPRARTNGPAFLLGWIVGITAVGTIVLLVSSGVDATDDDRQATWVSLLELALGLLLVALAVKQWRGRPRGDLRPRRALGEGARRAQVMDGRQQCRDHGRDHPRDRREDPRRRDLRSVGRAR